MGVVFDETVRRILDGGNFATVATVDPDGGPHGHRGTERKNGKR